MMEGSWSHVLQWKNNSWMLPEIYYEFYFPFESWWTRLLVSVRWGYDAYSKFNDADVVRVLWWSHYFSKLVAPSIPGSVTTRFLSFEVFEGKRVQKQPAHVRRIETKYWVVHFKHHCRNSSPGCIKHKEKCECMHHCTRWTFSALNTALFFVFWFQCNLFFGE
jgi:hypothetical protein